MLISDAERLSRFSEIAEEFSKLPVVAVRVDEPPQWAIPWRDVLKTEPSMPDGCH